MYFLKRGEELDIERETVLAVLESALPRGMGSRVARKAGITNVYLSNIRQRKRMPRLRTAEKIAPALPLSAEQQQRWLHHVRRFWELRSENRNEARRALRDMPGEPFVVEIRNAHHAATYAPNAVEAQAGYRHVGDACEQLLELFNPDVDLVNYLELAFVLQDVASVLNRNDEALWHAKRIRQIVGNLQPLEYPRSRERIEHFQVNAIHAEAVALHNLGLEKEAILLYEELEETPAFQKNRVFWRPHMNRAQIVSLAGLKRFPISKAEGLEEQARKICEKRAEEYDPLYAFRLSEAMARAYVTHANLKKAEAKLRPLYDELKRIPHLGPLHQVVFLRTFARLYWRRGGECTEWAFFINQGSLIAREAGLLHQLDAIRREYGDAR